jgi:ribonuclease P protein component
MITPSSDPATPHLATAPFPRLKRRAEFLRTASGRRTYTRAFTLQMIPTEPQQPARFGLTVSKRTGTSVVRNRIRRRLRAALQSLGGLAGKAGHDYVLVARRELLTLPFAILIEALAGAMRDIHRQSYSPGPGAGSPRPSRSEAS